MIPNIKMLDRPTRKEANNKTILQLWERKVNSFIKRMSTLYENMALALSLVRGQCSDLVREKVEAKNNYAETRREINVF